MGPDADRANRGPIFALDVSSLARWLGTPTGMLRVERELATYARSLGNRVTLVIYDGECRAFRPVAPEWADALLGWFGRLEDTSWWQAAALARPPFLPSRHRAIMILERRRLQSKSTLARRLYDVAQRRLLALKPSSLRLDDPDGNRLDLVPSEEALGVPIRFRPGDILFSAASDWWLKDPEELRRLCREDGLSLSALCFDLIPLTHPHWYSRADVERFRDHWNTVFEIANVVIVNSNAIRDDVVRYRHSAGLREGRIEVIPLGIRPPRPPRYAGHLPSVLRQGAFALYVSTIEPRRES